VELGQKSILDEKGGHAENNACLEKGDAGTLEKTRIKSRPALTHVKKTEVVTRKKTNLEGESCRMGGRRKLGRNNIALELTEEGF